MRRNRLKKKYILPLGALLAVAVTGGTYAYFSQDLSAGNQFLTGKYDTNIREEFDPPDNWMPGVEIPKSVRIENTGDVPVVAVARFTESCVRREDVTVSEPERDKDGNLKKDADGNLVMKITTVAEAGKSLGTRFPLSVDDEGNPEDHTEWQDIALKKLGDGTSVVDFDPSVKPENYGSKYKDKWIHYHVVDPSDPVTTRDYFIYAGIIEGGQTTPPLLESVTLNPKLQATVMGTKMVADVGEKGENRYTYTNALNKYGYDSVKYKLTVDAKTVQATKAAVDEVFGTGETLDTDLIPAELEPLLEYVKSMCVGNPSSERQPEEP